MRGGYARRESVRRESIDRSTTTTTTMLRAIARREVRAMTMRVIRVTDPDDGTWGMQTRTIDSNDA